MVSEIRWSTSRPNGVVLSAMPRTATPQPTRTSSVQWLPVTTTTTAVPAAYVTASACSGFEAFAETTAHATHSAQPQCRDGIAASSLVNWPKPLGAEACADHQPMSAYLARVST